MVDTSNPPDTPAPPGTSWALAGSTPVPDPTKLTTDAVSALEHQLKELFATQLMILDERFRGIDSQLGLVERQRVEQKADTKSAVDAALTAQREAVREQTTASEAAIAKSEAATSKQLEQLQLTFTTALAGLSTALADLKDRVTIIESLRLGQVVQKTESRAVTAGQMAAAGLAITLLLAALTVIGFLAAGG